MTCARRAITVSILLMLFSTTITAEAATTRAKNKSVCVRVVLQDAEKTAPPEEVKSRREEDDTVPISTPPQETSSASEKADDAAKRPANPYANPASSDAAIEKRDQSDGAPDTLSLEGPPAPSTAPPPKSTSSLTSPPSRQSDDHLRASATPGAFELDKPLPVRPSDRSSITYLKRLIEHFVSHQPGYVAVGTSCDETIRVELYPLLNGWTVFISYSGTGREERVETLYPDELSQFAERAVLALLHGVSISETINRENVLKADSTKSIRRIKGTSHFMLGVGTQLRGGMFDTATEETTGPNAGGVARRVRVVTPLTFLIGYKGRFEVWGLEAVTHVGMGTGKTAARKNAEGGHIDYGAGTGMSIHVLRYLNPRGLTSFYLGAGSTFELLWFSAIRAEAQRTDKSRSYIFSGGLDVDGVLGWEFMRASAVQFLLQGEINLPAYALKNENNYGAINTWFPGLSIKLGMVF